MAFDERLAARIRAALAETPRVTERRMFGGICFLIDGKMCCGILENEMIVRVAKDEYATLLQEPHVRVMDFTGRTMRGFLNVSREGLRTAPDLRRWIERGAAVARLAPSRGTRKNARSSQLPVTASTRTRSRIPRTSR